MLNGTGNALDNNITGNNANNNLNGGDGNDTLSGLAGNDTLNGGTGNDALSGGTGNDTYIVDSTGDSIIENANEGTDAVQSSASAYTLGSNLENLTLLGTAQGGTGNELDNIITGNDANNSLNGAGGNDTLSGTAGDDTLDGGTGNDAMSGGTGNDTYIVDSIGDSITENLNEGTDAVESSIDYTLGGNLENLVLLNTALNGTGNGLANTITGNEGNNNLNGGVGNDTLLGNGGADILLGAGGADSIKGGIGNDTITGGIGSDTIHYASGDGLDRINGFITGAGGDFLSFSGIAAVDVRIVTTPTGTNTQFIVGDNIAGNAGFGTGTVLLNLIATNFTPADIATNITNSAGTQFLFS